MASFTVQEHRPLKKLRLSTVGPDVYPQDPKQKEDELTTMSVKHGYNNALAIQEEHGSARNANITRAMVGASFNAIMEKKTELSTFLDQKEDRRKRLPINTKDNFWLVLNNQKSKNALDAWMKDLAGTRPLFQLAKKVPVINKKEEIFSTLCDFNVSMSRATWFIKMTNAFNTAVSEAKANKRMRFDPSIDWVGAICRFIREQLQRIAEYYQGNPSQTSFLTAGTTSAIDLDLTIKHWKYSTQLARYLFEEGLLDPQEFLNWLVDILEKMKSYDVTILNLIISQVHKYIHWFVKSQRLSRHLAHFCACKLAQYDNDHDAPLLQTPVGTPGGTDGVPPAPAVPVVSHNPVIALYGEYLQCPQHRQVILCLSAILQSITVHCPGSLVWHDFGEGKTSSVLSGSPLDLLTFSPSCLPMPPRADNQKIRSLLALSEQQVQLRGQAVEIRWSCDKGQKSAAGAVIRKTLNVLEALDRNNFSCVEANSCVDTLYNKIFGDKRPAKESNIKTHATSYDDAIVMLLCEWATSTQRAGEHRAIVVAKLLEKHQTEQLTEKFGDGDGVDEKESVGSEMLPPSGLPPYQKLLMHFLDKKAPALDENPTVENSAAFANLVLLFGELIRHDIFSHDAYICTLISRGDLAMTQPRHTATGGATGGGGAGAEKMDSESVKPEIQEEMRMELESQHLDDFEDIFAFRDDNHHSPSQPASIKSSTDQPLSAPTPGQAHTPVQAHTPGMARTPGAPNTPGAARTPGAPQTPSNTPGTAHTPGMAHTPGKAPTPSSLSLTPGGMAHTPMVPHTPASIPPPSSSVATTQQLPRRPSNHIAYATHFPIPQDEMSTHECNQRLVVLYGVGKAREEARLIAKKANKENGKLFAKKNSIDTTSGVIGGKQKKKKEKEESVNFEALFSRFQKLPYYDQQVVTGTCAASVLEAIAAFLNGTSVYLPVVDNVSYLFDLMQASLNISGLLEFIVQLVKELPEVKAQLHLKASSLANSYTTTLTLCSMAVLRRYHAYLILSHHLTVTVFESLCKIVKHVSNPSDCTSAERCILAYLYELYKCCYYIKSKFGESFGATCLKIHATLYTTLTPSASNLLWEPGFLMSLIDNPKTRPDAQSVKQLNDSPASRYSFVCNAMLNIVNCRSSDRLNELSLLCAELTACCTALSAEWLGVLKALCCSSNPSCGFIDVLTTVDVSDLSIHDSLAVFTAILIARHCFSLEDLVIHVALHSLLAACPTMASGGDQDAESGARLTCHILFRLFQTPQVLPGASADGGKSAMWVRASCDRHLLEAAHDSISVGAVVAVLKAGLMLGDSCSDERSSPSNHKGSPQDLISSMLSKLDDHDLDMMGMIGNSTKGRGGMERAGLSDYAQHTLREICSQEWVREKFLKDPKALFNSELLLDKMLSHAQAQQLVQMICYPGNIPSFLCEDEDDEEDSEEQRNISRILKNLDRWSMRVSWLELQLMFKQAAPSEMSMLLENISKATIDVFEEQTEKWMNQGYSSWQQADADSWADNDSVWLVAPLVARLPSSVQGRVLKLAGQVLETGSNFWSAKNAKDKERHLQKSTALLGHQPFLSLVLTCLQGQDEQREGLLKSLHDELEKFVNNAKEEQERGVSTDERLKSMVEEALLLRLSLVGGLFDTIQKNNGNVQDWTILLIQLVSHSVVDINNNSELFRVVEDMLSVLIHGTLVSSESSEKGEENRRTYTGLTRKLKRELGELQSESIDQIRTLLPLPKQHYMVITSERHTCQTEARGHRAVGFDTIDGKQGLQVTGRQRVSAWEILEGHKNPAPLSLAWFGAIRQERKVLNYEEHFRMLLLHTHSQAKPDNYFLEPPNLPPEELEPLPEKQETKLVEQLIERKQPEPTVKKKKAAKRRTSRATSQTNVNTSYINPNTMPQMGFRQEMYGGTLPPPQSSWGYRPTQPQHPGYYSQQHLAPGGPRFSPQSAPRQALSSYLRARGQSNQDVYLHGNPGAIPPQQPQQQMHPAMLQKQQQLRQKLRQQQQQQAYMNRLSGGSEAPTPMYGQQQTPPMMQGINYPQMAPQGLTPVYRSYQNVPPQSMMESASNSPMMGSSFSQPYQGHSMGVPSMPPQQGSGYMGQQPPQQTQFASGTRYGSVGGTGLRGADPSMPGTTSMEVDGMSSYSQMAPQTGAAQGGAGYMTALQQQQQQQRLQQMRQQQQQMLAMQQSSQQQIPQQQRAATMMPQQLQQQMSTNHGQPPQYSSYPQY